jgi:hypothetical protein
MADMHEEGEAPEEHHGEGSVEEEVPTADKEHDVVSSGSTALPGDLRRYIVASETNATARLDVASRNVKAPLLTTIRDHAALLNTPLVSLS